jgi:WD40 repeat protein/tRNA A-37 threonylcarbamoyl transferase component Bud32
MTACPADDVLKQVLAEQLTAEGLDTVVSHVAFCARCQGELARLTEEEADRFGLHSSRPPRNAEAISPGGSRSSPPAGENGGLVEGFDILECLGRGGMGVVYKARDRKLKRLVALKMLPAELSLDPERVLRFRTEAAAAARLHHPNIVPIYEIGESDGRPYFCSEYVEGGTIGQHLAGSPQPPRAAAEMIETLARAIEYAHARGIIHRDLKPANILLARGASGDFVPKVADFGLAKHVDDASGLTRTGEVLGTPSYMAPEQALGDAGALSPRTDVYALGAILYEMLTGRPPFRGATVLETLDQVRNAEPVPPSRLVPQLTRDLETVCLKCLEKAPARRYQCALALADEVRRYLVGEPILARPAGPLERVWKWARRRPSAASLIGVSILTFAALVALGVGSYFYGRVRTERDTAEGLRTEATQERDRANRLRGAADAERERAEGAEATVRRLLYSADMLNAQQAWEENNIAGMRELLGKYRPDPGKEDLRGFEWYYLERLSHSELLCLRGHDSIVSSVDFSPDGSRIASGGWDGVVKVWDAATGKELFTLRGHAGWVRCVAFGPKGERLASCGQDQTVRVWDLNRRSVLHTLRGHSDMPKGVAFHPGGKWIASCGNDHTVMVWNAETGKVVRTLKGHTNVVEAVDFSRDGKLLASAGFDGTLRLWDPASGKEVAAFADAGGGVAFSPDGKSIASAYGLKVQVWDIAKRVCTHSFEGHSQQIVDVAFSPDGGSLASASYDNTVRIWDLRKKEEPRVLKGHTDGVYGVAFSPDGRRLASGSGDTTVKVWDLRHGQDAISLRGHNHQIACVAFSPTEGQLASASIDGSVKLWNPETGEVIKSLVGPRSEVNSLAFSGDGKFLASGHWDKNVYVWDLESGSVKYGLAGGHTGRVLAVAFSRDGRFVASGGEDQLIKIWDLSGARKPRTLQGHAQEVTGLDFSLDGRLLASSSADATIRIWTLDGDQPPLVLRGHGKQVTGVAFSPDGSRLASSGFDLAVRLWDPATGENTQTLKGSTDGVHRPAFSPDGRRIAAGDQNSAVKVWDLTTGQVTLILKGHRSYVFTVAFSPDGQRLATAGVDETIRVWYAPRPGGGEHLLGSSR